MIDKPAMVKLPHLSVRLSYAQSNAREPGSYVRLVIEDDDSRLRIVEVELDPSEIFNLMSSRSALGSGQANRRAELFGLTCTRKRVHLDRKEWGLEYDSTEDHPAVQAALRGSRDEGWEVRYERVRGQHYIHCIRWDDIADDQLETGADDAGTSNP